MKFRNLLISTISLKIFLALTVLLFFQAVFLFWQLSIKIEKNIIYESGKDINTLLISEQQTLEYLAKKNDFLHIQKNISLLAVKNELNWAFLVDHEQKIIAATQLANINKNLSSVIPVTIFSQLLKKSQQARESYKGLVLSSANKRNLYAVIPIKLGRLSEKSIRTDKTGYLYIDYNLDKQNKYHNTLLQELFIPELLFLIVTVVLLAWFFHTSISRRLQRLNLAVHDISQLKYQHYVDVRGQDEISELSKSFNQMIDDIHEHHQQLLKREQDLAITLNSIGDAVIVTNKNGQVQRMNPVAEQLTGWSEAEAFNLSVKEVFPIINASTREKIQNPVDKVIANGETIYLSNHTTLMDKYGKEYQIADSAAPIRNPDGGIEGMVLVFNDVTEQYQLRQAARNSEKKYQTLAKVAPVGIYYTDKEGNCLYVNDKWCEITGMEAINALGEGWIKGLHQDDRESIFSAWNKMVNDDIPFALEYRFQDAGKTHWVYGQASAEYEDSRIIGYVGTITDITDRKKIEYALRHSQKMDALGKLTGGIAHDYNNMLGVILGYSEMMVTMLDEKSVFKKYTYEILRAGERGAKLTKKLLSFSRKQASSTEAININDVLLDEQDMLEKTLTAHIELILNLASDIWLVSLDESELEDAIVNMSINAMHAMEGKGKLIIQTCNETLNKVDAEKLQLKAGEYVLLSVSDTGKGMDEYVSDKIFEPFFTTKGELGTGLGLSQVYGFVERSQGEISVYSEVGLGTRITLYFPRCYRVDGDSIDKADSEDQEGLTGTETILVVDDEKSLMILTSEIFQRQGYRVFSAESGKEALGILEREEVDLIFSDVVMPEMDGFQLAAIVQKQYPAIKIQLASGFSDERHILMKDDTLYNNLLEKPYHSISLLKRIRELLDQM